MYQEVYLHNNNLYIVQAYKISQSIKRFNTKFINKENIKIIPYTN